jgi:hypothetical protein
MQAVLRLRQSIDVEFIEMKRQTCDRAGVSEKLPQLVGHGAERELGYDCRHIAINLPWFTLLLTKFA